MKIFLTFIIALLISTSAATALASVSHMGFHPDQTKTFTVYTGIGGNATGTFDIKRVSNNAVVYSGTLARPVDYNNVTTTCQGNNTCLVGDFSDFTVSGSYYITTSTGDITHQFSISNTIYEDNVEVFNEFYNALSQTDSSYHADMNQFMTPAFSAMADGSYIMTADQASLTLMRLGNAYRRNPDLLGGDQTDMLYNNAPDVIEYMVQYTDYLEGLQDANLQQRTDGVGFRTSTAMIPVRMFTPAATNQTVANLYNSANGFIQTVPVVSLCGSLSGAAYTTCIDNAALYYKCQVGELCLEQTYNNHTAVRIAGTDGLGVDHGWDYEFGCFYDVDLQNGNFNSAVNPCMVYDATEERTATSAALYAYTSAIPAINEIDPIKAQEMLLRATATSRYIKATYPAFVAGDNDTGFYGAANFQLYAMTGNVTYLDEAYSVRNVVSQTLISDSTRDNEFYWEQYVLHKDALLADGKTYELSGWDPIRAFTGKMWGDYKDRGIMSISANGEHVYQYDNNIGFQNSRYMLLEGIFAAKAEQLALIPNATSTAVPDFSQEVADAQLSWLTGNNGVDIDSGFSNDIRSLSFIFGIGNTPEVTEFHSRFFMTSGYSAASGGQVIGMRGSGLKYNNGSDFVYLDGMTTVLGHTLGAMGNEYQGEIPAQQFNNSGLFKNGMTYIPGWINGAYDLSADTDTIYNYRDNRDTYEFTESTNEMVAVAVELFAFQDAYYNNMEALDIPLFDETGPTQGTISISTTPGEASVYIDGDLIGTTPASGYFNFTLQPGTYDLTVGKENYTNQTYVLGVVGGELVLDLTLDQAQGTVRWASSPVGADVYVDGMYKGMTPTSGYLTFNLTTGAHQAMLSLAGYENSSVNFNVTTTTQTFTTTLSPQNATLNIASVPDNASVYVDGVLKGATPASGYFVMSATPGSHTIVLTKAGYANHTSSITLTPAQNYTQNTNMSSIPNAILLITSIPDANVTIDDVLVGLTPLNVSVTAGAHTIHIAKVGFASQSANITAAPNAIIPLNYVLQGSATPQLLSTSVANVTALANGSYRMAETADGRFTVQFDQPVTVTWFLNGLPVQNAATVADRNTYVWNPGMLYTSNSIDAQLVASGNGIVNATFNITVINDINPFWENDVSGSPDGRVVIITNNDLRQYTNVTVTLQNVNGLYNVSVPFEGNNFADAKWAINLSGLAQDNTFIRRVIVENNGTQYYADVAVGADLAHYRQVTSSGSGGGSGGGGGGGGGAFFKNERPKALKNAEIAVATNSAPEFVYAVFSKDVIPVGESIQLSIDAKDNEEVASAIATMQDDNGKQTKVPLKLTAGSKGYGTWSATLSDFIAGKVSLVQIDLKDNLNMTAKVAVADRAFYVIGEEVKQSEETVVVYAILDKSTINPGENVTIRMDVRDFKGIESVKTILKSKDQENVVTLHLVSGSPQYGTWEATVQLDEPDTTYALTMATIGNGITSRDVRIYGQKVYVNYVAAGGGDLLTGNVVAEESMASSRMGKLLSNPGTPLLVGLTGMGVAMVIVIGTFLRKDEE